MRVFFDSSAFVKRFIEEQGSREADEYCQKASELGLSIVCFPEMISALCRKIREGSLSGDDYLLLKEQIAEDIEQAR
jgi:predicted nucleic acid-binding protein